MKKSFNKITSMLLALCLVLGSVAFGAGEAFATGEDWVLGISNSFWVGETDYTWVYDANDIGVATLTNVTSSNAAVIAVAKDSWEEDGITYAEFWLTAKGAGSATVTATFKDQDGNEGTVSEIVTVKKYPKQIKSLRVNGKKVKVSKHKYNYSKRLKKKTKVNIKMALKKGWKISSVYGERWTKSGNNKSFKIKKSTLLKGKTIKFPKKYTGMWISVEMKKGNNYIYYSFDFYR